MIKGEKKGMKTFEIVQNLKPGETHDFGNSPVGGCVVRKTQKGVIAKIHSGNWYVKDKDVENAFACWNCNGLNGELRQYAIKSRYAV